MDEKKIFGKKMIDILQTIAAIVAILGFFFITIRLYNENSTLRNQNSELSRARSSDANQG